MTDLELQKTAVEVRKGIVTGVHAAKAGHPGGSLSAADVFTYLYFEEMNIDPKEPKKPDRDRFVLSKGHTAPGLYAALAQRIFSGGRPADAAACRRTPAGTSMYTAYTGRRCFFRLAGAGHINSSGHGAFCKDEQ